jgi:hypothetical protein
MGKNNAVIKTIQTTNRAQKRAFLVKILLKLRTIPLLFKFYSVFNLKALHSARDFKKSSKRDRRGKMGKKRIAPKNTF